MVCAREKERERAREKERGREREEKVFFFPSHLSLAAPRGARGEEVAVEDIAATCINGTRFSLLFQNSTGPPCYVASAVTKRPVFTMGFTLARGAR